jgi:hypothetical protein
MITLDDLLAYCFASGQPTFYAEFAEWLRGSRRFRAFVESNRGKIRAKLKSARDEAGLLDVRAELAAAMTLLREDHFTLVYEAYAAAKQRGPDFTVTFKTHTRFNVEVRRMRDIETGSVDDARLRKLAAVLSDKVGQMPPSSINLLWLAVEGEVAEAELAAAAAALRQRAERKDEEYFTRRGFADAAVFLKQYQQLSGVILWQTGAPALWLNPLARHKISPELAAAIRRLGFASD